MAGLDAGYLRGSARAALAHGGTLGRHTGLDTTRPTPWVPGSSPGMTCFPKGWKGKEDASSSNSHALGEFDASASQGRRLVTFARYRAIPGRSQQRVSQGIHLSRGEGVGGGKGGYEFHSVELGHRGSLGRLGSQRHLAAAEPFLFASNIASARSKFVPWPRHRTRTASDKCRRARKPASSRKPVSGTPA